MQEALCQQKLEPGLKKKTLFELAPCVNVRNSEECFQNTGKRELSDLRSLLEVFTFQQHTAGLSQLLQLNLPPHDVIF